MNKKTRDAFYSLWTLAIFLCIGLSLFVMLLASCVKAGDIANDTASDTASETITEIDEDE